MDIEKLLADYADDGGNIGQDRVAELIRAINTAVGTGFVPKERYDKKLAEVKVLNGKIADMEDSRATETDWKQKYEAEMAAHSGTKAAIEAEKALAGKTAALTELLKSAGANEKVVGLMLKGFDLSAVELDGEGYVKDPEKFVEPMKAEYGDFFSEVKQEGVNAGSPPGQQVVDVFVQGFNEK